MVPDMPFNNSSVDEFREDKMIREKTFPGGFVFLDRCSRVPLENAGRSRSRRSVITLKDFRSANEAPLNSFPLQLPFGTKDQAKTEIDSRTDDVPAESSLLPRLPFRSMKSRDSSQAFMRAHYNEENQEDARKQYMNSNRKKKITSLDMHHMDPAEQKAIPSWGRTPASPGSLPPPLPLISSKTPSKEAPQTKPSNSTRAHTDKRHSLSESKRASNGSNTTRGSMTKPALTSRLNHNAKAA